MNEIWLLSRNFLKNSLLDYPPRTMKNSILDYESRDLWHLYRWGRTEIFRLMFKTVCQSLLEQYYFSFECELRFHSFRIAVFKHCAIKVAIECLGFDLMTISIKRCAMIAIAIAIGTFCEFSNSASSNWIWPALQWSLFGMPFEHAYDRDILPCILIFENRLIQTLYVNVANELFCFSTWTKFLNFILRPTSTLNLDSQHTKNLH